MNYLSEDDSSSSGASSYYAALPLQPTALPPTALPPTASETTEVKALESNPVKMKLTQDILLQKEQIDILKDIYKTIRNFKQQIDTNNSMIRPTLTAIRNCNCKKETIQKPRPISPELHAAMYTGGGRKRRKTKRHKRKAKNTRKQKRKTKKKRRKKRKTKRKN